MFFYYCSGDDFVLPEDSGLDTQDDSTLAIAGKRTRHSPSYSAYSSVDESFLKMMLNLMKDVPSGVKNKFQADMFATIYRIRGQYLHE